MTKKGQLLLGVPRLGSLPSLTRAVFPRSEASATSKEIFPRINPRRNPRVPEKRPRGELFKLNMLLLNLKLLGETPRHPPAGPLCPTPKAVPLNHNDRKEMRRQRRRRRQRQLLQHHPQLVSLAPPQMRLHMEEHPLRPVPMAPVHPQGAPWRRSVLADYRHLTANLRHRKLKRPMLRVGSPNQRVRNA